MNPSVAAPGAFRLPSDQDASGRSFGDEELRYLAEVLASGTLTSTKGAQVRVLEETWAAMLGVPHVVACSSGSAAVHAAVAAVDPEPGEEVVTTPITDMGALSPILYQGAVPVFADVDPRTGNVTAETVAAVVSERTRAVVVTHLFGNPCAMDPLLELAAARGVPVIEDAAQAFLARSRGRLTGTMGAAGCFSLQQGKHVTSGEGGLVATTDDRLARRIRVFVNKAWPYGEPDPDHEFLALNYRLSELQGAVARAQLEKLPALLAARRRSAEALAARLRGVPGVEVVAARPGDEHAWWRIALLVDPAVPGGPHALADRLRAADIPSAPRYVQKPAFECAVLAEQRTFGASRWPFTQARPEAVDYSPERFPGTYAFLRDVLVLGWNERCGDREVDVVGDRVEAAMEELGR